MKKLLGLVLVLGLFLGGVSVASAATYVRGYYRPSGTYVMPHYRSSSNSYRYDNWSTRGNYNPYTGSKGYKSYWNY